MRQANLEELDIGVIMGGRKINNLRYADDTTLLSESKVVFLQLVTSVNSTDAKQFNCAFCDTSMTFCTHLV